MSSHFLAHTLISSGLCINLILTATLIARFKNEDLENKFPFSLVALSGANGPFGFNISRSSSENQFFDEWQTANGTFQ
jgi:hypothetical protein